MVAAVVPTFPDALVVPKTAPVYVHDDDVQAVAVLHVDRPEFAHEVGDRMLTVHEMESLNRTMVRDRTTTVALEQTFERRVVLVLAD